MGSVVNVHVQTFESDNRGPALAQMAAWLLLNGNRFDVVTYVGNGKFAQLFYVDTQEGQNADGKPGTS